MKRKETFEVIIRRSFESDGSGEYATTEQTQASYLASTELLEDYSEIYAGGLIETVVKFLDRNGVNGLNSLCEAIERLGETNDKDGNATVFMGPLFDTALQILYDEKHP